MVSGIIGYNMKLKGKYLMYWLLQNFIKYYLFNLFLLIPCIISGQNYTVKTFTTGDGLANNDIIVMALDSTGFLWIGTMDGLSRFDGYEFKNYYHLPGETNSISFFSIYNLAVDKTNNLWILTGNSEIVRYDRVNDSFKKLTNIEINNSEEIYDLSVDRNGELWIICKSNIFKRDPASGKFIQYKIFDKNENPSSLDPSKFNLFLSWSNKIWLVGFKTYEMEIKNANDTIKKLIIRDTYRIESSLLQSTLDYNFSFRFSFYESPYGNRWLFSNIGLFQLDPESSTFKEFKGKINTCEFTGKNNFEWAWSERGFYSIDPKTNKIRIVNPETSQIVKAILRQNRKMIWISVFSKTGNPIGLRQIVFTNDFFKNYLIEKNEYDLPAVFAITKDERNNLWAGVRGKDHILRFTPENNIEVTGQLTNELFEHSGHIRTLKRANDGIWIGYYNDLLMFYDFKTGKFKRHYADEWTFRALAINKEENLIIGATNLSMYYPESGKTELLWKSEWRQNIYKLYLDDNGNVWAGTSIGMLLRYNINTKESAFFSVSTEGYHIVDICPGNGDELWLATIGGGLCKFNVRSGKSVFYTTAVGLSSNSTYCILKDKSGNIWISTNNGISMLNTSTGRFRIFNNADGLEITEFNSGASFISEDGEFFLGGMGGFVGFYPDSLSYVEEKEGDFRLLLGDLKVSGEKKILRQPINESDTIILSKGENNFQLSFSTTDFINSENKLFRYKLERLTNEWAETDSRNRYLNYSNLKPGRYILYIQATNFNGDWSTEKRIIFRLLPYFHQTWFFRISVPLIIAIMIAGLFWFYIRQLKISENHKLDELKLQSLRGQMNPHFIFNSLNSINYFISNNDKISANRYISDFSRVIRSILTNMGNNFIPFESELNSLKNYLEIEHLRFSDKFDFKISADEKISRINPNVAPGLVQPFIENAIWHGIKPLEKRKGFINIRFLPLTNEKIVCIIEDDGIGRISSLEKQGKVANHKSRGISIVAERLQLIGRLLRTSYNLNITDLYPDSKETGTRVEIELPLKIE